MSREQACIIEVSACVSGHWCNSVYKQQEVDLPQFFDRGGYELHRLEDISSRVSGPQLRVRLSLMSLNKKTVGGLFSEPLTKYLYFTAYFQNDPPKYFWEGKRFPGGFCVNWDKELDDLTLEKVINTRLQRIIYGLLSLFLFSFPTVLQMTWHIFPLWLGEKTAPQNENMCQKRSQASR